MHRKKVWLFRQTQGPKFCDFRRRGGLQEWQPQVSPHHCCQEAYCELLYLRLPWSLRLLLEGLTYKGFLLPNKLLLLFILKMFLMYPRHFKAAGSCKPEMTAEIPLLIQSNWMTVPPKQWKYQIKTRIQSQASK